jgi:hypothetical protein
MSSHYEAIKDQERMLTINADDHPLIRLYPAELKRTI